MNLASNFGPNIVNEFRFGGNRLKAFFNGPGSGGVANPIGAAVATAFNAQHYPAAGPFGGVNGRNINLSTAALQDLAGFDTQFRFSGTTVLGDNFTWIKGNHTTKWGFERRWVYSNGANNFGRSETLNFDFPTTFNFPILRNGAGQNISRTGLAGTIQNYASFLYGLVALQNQSQFFDKSGHRSDQDYREFRVREFDVFGQDTWKVRSNLTLNYGLRWEYKGVPYEVNGQLSTLVNQDPSGLEPAGGFRFQLVGKNSGTDNELYKRDRNNFGPRVGFAYSPAFESGFLKLLTGGPTKTSIRGGYGIFYDRVFGNLFGNARGNPPFQQDFQAIPFNDTITGTLPEISRVPTQTASPVVPTGAEIFPVIFALPGNNIFQSKYANPYEQKWNIGFQRELGNQLLFEANYVGAKGTSELRVIDGQLTSIPRCNAIAPTVCGGPISTSGGSNLLNGRLNDSFFQVAENLSIGFSTYNAMQLTMTKTLSNKAFGLGQIQGAYTWSHSIDNSADPLVGQSGERTFPRDSSGFAGGSGGPERGDSGFDTRHRFVLNYIYEIPLRFDNKNLDRYLGNWEIAGIWSVQSGHPYSIFGGVDSAGSGLSQRASFGNGTNNLTPTPANLVNPRVQTGPDRSLFTNPTPPSGAAPTFGVQGNVGRGAFVGPGFNKFDFTVIKRFPISEEVRFRLQADFFNLFNRVNFGQPVNTITSLNFGQSTTAGAGRIIQFAARFEF